MDDKIVDLTTIRDQRVINEIDTDEAKWTDVRNRLFKVMDASGLSDVALVSATLRALLDATWDADDLANAKQRIINALAAFR